MDTIENEELLEKILTFKVENDIYGIELAHVIEIINMHPITKIPFVPNYVKGIINLRGSIIPVIDIRTKYKYEDIQYGDKTNMIVLSIEDITVCIIVDGVDDVVTLTKDNTLDSPEFKSTNSNKDIKNIITINKNVVFMIDVAKFLDYKYQDDNKGM